MTEHVYGKGHSKTADIIAWIRSRKCHICGASRKTVRLNDVDDFECGHEDILCYLTRDIPAS